MENHPFSMGKSTISTGPFSIANCVCLPGRVYPIHNPSKITIKSHETTINHHEKSPFYSHYVGLSENSVPLNPMVLLIIIPIKWLFHWEYTQHFQTNPCSINTTPTWHPPFTGFASAGLTSWCANQTASASQGSSQGSSWESVDFSGSKDRRFIEKCDFVGWNSSKEVDLRWRFIKRSVIFWMKASEMLKSYQGQIRAPIQMPNVRCIHFRSEVPVVLPVTSPFLVLESPTFGGEIHQFLSFFLVKPIPSGKHTKSYWKWWFIVDLPINSMVIFHRFLYVYQRRCFQPNSCTSEIPSIKASRDCWTLPLEENWKSM